MTPRLARNLRDLAADGVCSPAAMSVHEKPRKPASGHRGAFNGVCAMMYLSPQSEAYGEWIKAHARRQIATKEERRAWEQIKTMPRFLLERELCQWLLADKEAHTGRKLGAKPRALPFAQFTQWRAPVATDRGTAREPVAEYVLAQAERCVTLWRAVIQAAAEDLLRMWGATQADVRESRLLMEAQSGEWAEAREAICACAMIEPDALRRAADAGRLSDLAKDAIGRERYVTRMINKQDSIPQPDLFYSLGVR